MKYIYLASFWVADDVGAADAAHLLMESWMSSNFSNWRLNLHGLQWSSRLKRLENQRQPILGANLYNEPCKESKQNIAFSRLSLTVRKKNLIQECDSGKLKALTRIVPRRHIKTTERNLFRSQITCEPSKEEPCDLKAS